MTDTIQGYISNYLSHFVGRSLHDQDQQFDLLCKIIRRGWILSKNFVSTADHELPSRIRQVGISFPLNIESVDINEVFIPDVVCLADIPFSEIEIHKNKYSNFGLSFSKIFLASKGANPVFYISSKSTPWGEREPDLHGIFKQTMKYFIGKYNTMMVSKGNQPITGTRLDEHKLMQYLLKYVFCYLKFWDFSLDDSNESNFYFEREWRLYGGFQFNVSDIKKIIIPSQYEDRFGASFPNYSNGILHSEISE